MRRAAIAVLWVCATGGGAGGDEAPRHRLPAARHGGTVVGLCDGQTAIEIDARPGTALSRDQAQAVSDRLMAQWKQQHPGARWDDAVAQNGQPPRAAAGPAQPTTSTRSPPPARPSQQSGTYTNFGARDELVWQKETQAFVDEGNAIFHDAKKLGGTIGVSCDMCHPNAANTHPESYPKYQVQLQRVALLRDMINWCIENPVKGKALPDDSRTLRALEAYILAQRKGHQLDYGRH